MLALSLFSVVVWCIVYEDKRKYFGFRLQAWGKCGIELKISEDVTSPADVEYMRNLGFSNFQIINAKHESQR